MTTMIDRMTVKVGVPKEASESLSRLAGAAADVDDGPHRLPAAGDLELRRELHGPPATRSPSPPSPPDPPARGCGRTARASPASSRAAPPSAPPRPRRSRPRKSRDARPTRSPSPQPPRVDNGRENRRANDTDRYVLAAQPGKSQGRPPRMLGLEAHRPQTACPTCVLPERPPSRSPDRTVGRGQQPSERQFHAPRCRRPPAHHRLPRRSCICRQQSRPSPPHSWRRPLAGAGSRRPLRGAPVQVATACPTRWQPASADRRRHQLTYRPERLAASSRRHAPPAMSEARS